MSQEQMITLCVNDREYRVVVEPTSTLLHALREQIGLTGTKEGCGAGDCGACTVIVEGRPTNACLLLAIEMDGVPIQTIEGLAEDGDLHALQQAFVKNGALQCGFCTPGMLMAAKALLDENPSPTEQEVRDGLQGNLCRCGTYPRILESMRTWQEFREERFDTRPLPDEHRDQERDLDVVSHGVTRYDAPDKVTGRAVYTDDIALPDMVFGKILTSPIPHGIIRSIDTSAAEALPGVLSVLTGKDVPDILHGVSPARYDEYGLAKDRVRYVGDEVAAVAAVDEETAARACALIQVDYEELPAVFDAEEAMQDGAPQIHPENPRFANNINTSVDWDFGDVDAGFKEADVVLEQRFVGNRTYQAPIEPHVTIARWEHHGGKLTLWSSTQTPHYLHNMLARVFEMPMGSIRVIKPAVGGGFGVKAETTSLDICSVIFAKQLGRPVKMRYTREEMFVHWRGRHRQIIDLKVGVKNDGTISAVDSRIVLDGGAYTSYGVITAYYAGSMLPTLYKMPNYRYEGFRMYTNLPACGAFRGHGVPQPRWAFESMLDMCAEKIGMDPMAIRMKNAMDANTRTETGLDIGSCEFKETLRQAAEASDWNAKRGKLPKGKGIGVGCGGFVSGAGYPIYRSDFPHSNAMIRAHEDGNAVSLHIAAADIGQGSDTVLTQIAAEELGIPYDRVWLVDCDSVLSPLDLGSYSSRVTLMGGNAVLRAASDLKQKLFAVVSDALNCEADQLVARDGQIFVGADPEVGMPWDEAARLAFSKDGPVVGTGWYRPPHGLGGDYKGAAVGTSPAYSFSTAVCEVSVDLETGYVTVERFWDSSDGGTVINPVAFHSQVEGSIVMGMGETLMEDSLHRPDGSMMNPNLHDYLVPTIQETPAIQTTAVESYEPRGPFGAKEVGEGSMLPIFGAIANAIHDATGVWVCELPITPERVLKALQAASQD